MRGVINKSVKVLKNTGHFGIDELQKSLIFLSEGIGGVGIDIDLAHIFALYK